jgi:predicted AlkP superfamily phosphohydrolase/phosphomutase
MKGNALHRALAFALVLVLSLALVMVSTNGCERRGNEPPRVLLVGWDGGSWRMVDPLLRAGKLPNVAALLERGTSARLVSTAIPVSSAAWTGAATGKTPGQNGIYSFFKAVPGSYAVRLIDARDNRATPIWRILTRHGMRSVVFGVPVTHPTEPIAGVMVGGMLTPIDGTWAHPAELDARLKQLDFLPDMGMWRRARPVSDTSERERQLGLKRDELLRLLDEEDWRLAWVVFKSLDVLSHASHDGRIDGEVGRHYERLDAVLGSLLARVGEETHVLLVSDHGFDVYEWAFNPRTWLLEEGLARELNQPPSGRRLGGALAGARAREHSLRRASLDMSQTRVMAGAAEGSFGGLRLNLAGREPEGHVEPEEYEVVLSDLEALLLAIEGPFGTPLVKAVHRARTYYPGPEAERLPDLIFEVDERVVVRVSRKAPTLRPTLGPTPDHDRVGIFAAAGPRIAAAPERGELSIFDIAPTVLELLGLPAYHSMTGRVAASMVEGAPKMRVAESDEPAEPAEVRAYLAGSGDRAEDGEVRSRLEALGYVE